MAYGDISAAILDSLEYDLDTGFPSHCLKVNDGILAIWNLTAGNAGIVRTYPIAADGTIGGIINSWLFEAGIYYGFFNVFEVATGIFLTCYMDDGLKLKAMTMAIAPDGTITALAIDTLVTASAVPDSVYGMAKKGDTNVYVVVWDDAAQDGQMSVITCDPDGTNLAESDTWEFEPDRGYLPHVAYIAGDIFAVSYLTATDGTLATIAVDDAGLIAEALIDTQVIDGVNSAAEAFICKLGQGDLVVVSYRDGANDGRIATFTIDDAGNISAPLSSLEFEGLNAHISVVHSLGVSATVSYFVVFYYNVDNDDTAICTFSSNSAGTISAEIDNLTLRAATGARSFNGVQVQPDIWAFVYVETFGNDGTLVTAGIETVQEAGPAGSGGNLAEVLVKNALI